MKVRDQTYSNVRITDLTPHPENPRQGDVGAIAASIQANGWFGAVIVQRDTGYILAGNHRVRAAAAAGADTVPALIVQCTEAEARRILLADNRTSDLATQDQVALLELLRTVAITDDLTGTGYDGDDLDDLIGDVEGPRRDLADDLRIEWGYVTWGSTRVRITSEEVDALNARYSAYTEENGTDRGFAAALTGDD